MKIAVKRLTRGEKGQVMPLALILLLISGLMAAPLLAHMSTGVLTGQVYETRTAELYAADAGVEDAVWNIQAKTDKVEGLTQCSQSTNYTVTGVNGKTVDVTITLLTIQNSIPADYLVESTATGDNSSGTKITAYISGANEYGDYSGLLNRIATSQNETDIAKKVTLIYPPGCEPQENYEGAWPPPAELCDWYWEDVRDETPYDSGVIDLAGVNMTKGPLYRDGGLSIYNSVNDPATLTLNGTLYVTGDTIIGTEKNEFTLDLDGHTIFVSSNSMGSQNALIISGRCSIKGPGAIIAVGDIEFKPKAQMTTDPVFVLSVLGTTYMQPSGTYFGAFAGSVLVEVQSGEHPTVTYPTGGFGGYGLNFPTGMVKALDYSIASWEATPLAPAEG